MSMQQGRVSGRVVVIVLFTGAVLLWGIVFMVGLRKRAEGRRDAEAEAVDSVSTPEEVRARLRELPESWVKVSLVEGQGYVLYVPCYSSNSVLVLRTAPDSVPGLACEYCDSLGTYSVKSVIRSRRDSAWQLRLDPPAGKVRILPVDDSLLKSYPEAPFKDRILLWTREGGGGHADTMLFVPKTQETEFETLRAEDENPEGCGGGGTGGDPD